MKRYYAGQKLTTTTEEISDFLFNIGSIEDIDKFGEVLAHYLDQTTVNLIYAFELGSAKKPVFTIDSLCLLQHIIRPTKHHSPIVIVNPHPFHAAKEYKFGELYAIDDIPEYDPTVTGYYFNKNITISEGNVTADIVEGYTGKLSYIRNNTNATHWTLVPTGDILTSPNKK